MEFTTARRLARFWTIATVITVVGVGAYISACIFLVYIAPAYVPFVTATPKYLISNIDPSMFLLLHIVLLFLAFDTTHRHERARMAEVLDAKPVSNVECQIGRLLGVSTLIWAVVAANVLVFHGIGLLCQAFGWHFAEPIDSFSILNLLVLDVPSTLLFWCALVIFLTNTLKNRLLVIATSLFAMIVYYFLVLRSPFTLLPLLSPLSNHTLYISDIVPELASITTVLIRIASVLAALLLIVLATILTYRTDGRSRQTKLVLVSILVVSAGAATALAVADTSHKSGQVAKWRKYHDSYVWNGSIDVTKISGEVNIDPGENLHIDLTYSFNVAPTNNSKLVFTFNPNMVIQELLVNEQPTEFNFKLGLLEVITPIPLDKESTHTMHIKANGVPNPRFAYFNSALNYQTDPTIGARTVKIFGTEGSIFRREYVGLLPGVHWYPSPGALQSNMTSGNASNDYFDIEITVDLARQDWVLVASGGVPEYSNSKYRVVAQAPVSQIGLFASDFERVSLNVEGIEFSIVLHRQHVKNLVLADNLEAPITDNIQLILNTLAEPGLTYPGNFLTFVEVPGRLRMVDGGWRMDVANSLPGVVMLKEYGYPTAPLHRRLQEEKESGKEYGYTERQIKGGQVQAIWRFLQDAVGTDSPWSTFPHRYWTQVTAASGQYASVLDQVVFSILSQPLFTWDFFSIYSTLSVTDMVVLNPITGYFTADPFGDGRGTLPLLHRLGSEEAPYGNRPFVWEHAETNSLADLPSAYGSRKDVEHLRFKCAEIAKGLASINGREKILVWLADVRDTFAGETYTYEQLLDLAKNHDLVVDPFLTEWITSTELPGYVYSTGTQVRIADDDQGSPQYQVTVEVRNVQPVSGYVQFLYVGPSGFERSPGVVLDAMSSKRINLVTTIPLDSLSLLTGLSLNRQSSEISLRMESEREHLDISPDPFEEESNWTPALGGGIVVDDLDPGFQIFQVNPKMKRSNLPVYLGGLFEPKLAVELDRGLPSTTPYIEARFPDIWYRAENAGAYGAIRRTYTIAWIRRDVPRVRYTAELPDSGRWHLEYHIPKIYFSIGETSPYKLALSHADESSEFTVEAGMLDMGWNTIRTFDLEKGIVHLDILGTEGPATLHADAIRWTQETVAEGAEESR